MSVDGKCDDRFSELSHLLAKSIESGDDLGASVCVTIDGKTVVDIWGGWTDAEKTKVWQADTLVNCWSCTKTVASLALLVLVDRGEVDLYAPVSKYWPEFAANGKDRIEVRHIISHTSGVAGWDQPVELADIYDADKSAEMLAAQAPWWEPGTASGYHGMTHGHLPGEVIRRVTGQTIGKFVAQEITGPLGADFHIGLDPSEDQRVSTLVLPPTYPIDMDAVDTSSPAYKMAVGPPIPPESALTEAWRRSEICAGANGQGNARSLAKTQSIVSHEGEFAGVQLLSPQTCELIFNEQTNGIDLVLGLPVRWGIGYALPDPVATPYLPGGRIAFWAGWGGSQVINDLDRHMTFAYMMNRMEAGLPGETYGIIGGRRSEALIRATYAALD